MLLQRWDPFREMVTLREAMDRLFQDSVVMPGTGFAGVGVSAPSLDIQETGDHYLVKLSIPGVRPEDVDIEVHDGTVVISGRYKAEDDAQKGRYLICERQSGAFRRAFTLPTAVNADQATAHYEHGVLTLTLLKAEGAKPKQIKVVAQQEQLAAGQAGSTQEHGQPAATAQPAEAGAASA